MATMSKRPATTSLTTPKAKKSREDITLEQKNKVLEALQRGNGASRVSDASTATPLDSDVDDELVELGSASSEDELPN
ncbi:hypothetical protein Hamer_G000148 [Homarus americanus]|uniref:Uncharacterized protein n=1 Tax=Homarus americanus TaxID=6706 RepID=A0A8J5TLG9_HOMAM|nr:hypothetical protein Hamer_G000148 [Homarus americanus]